jgi:hypothetical protein
MLLGRMTSSTGDNSAACRPHRLVAILYNPFHQGNLFFFSLFLPHHESMTAMNPISEPDFSIAKTQLYVLTMDPKPRVSRTHHSL